MFLRAVILLGLGWVFASPAPAQEVLQTSDGVWTRSFKGPHGEARVAWLDLGDSVLLADPVFPHGLRAARSALAATSGDKPLRYVVALSGSEAPGLEGAGLGEATLIVHENQLRHAAVADASRLLAVSERLILQSGAQRVEVHAVGMARSHADLVLWLPDSSTLLAGLLCSADEELPAATDTEGWRSALAKLRSMRPLQVIPGSGKPAGAELLEQQWQRVAAAAQRRAAQTELGSSRGSVVALPFTPGQARPQLVFLTPPRSADELAELQRLAPNVELRVVRSDAEAQRHAGEAHGADARFGSAEFLRAAGKLRWVQAGSAGVERYLAVAELRESEEVVFTNMKGMHGPAIADHAFAMLLLLARELRHYEEAQAARRWDRGGALQPFSLHGKTMLVVGLGGIGSEVARRARGFGMQVLATARTEKPLPDYVDRLETADQLDDLLPLADVVAICVPLTPETQGMFGARRFAAMKRGAYLINIARGRVCDHSALQAALESGQLGGACLDVTDPEPLPADHPLWGAPNLVLTPHVSGRAEVTAERRRALFAENLRRFAHGEPLLNVVDKAAGY